MSVVNVWSGATTSSFAKVVGKVNGSSARLAVSTDPGLSSPTFFGPAAPTPQGIVRMTATGLYPSTRYYYALEVDSVLDTTFPGQFLTHPPVGQPASFTIGMGSCAGATTSFPGVGNVLASARLSNHPVFDTIRQRALAEDWSQFIHMGDMHYYDIGSGIHVPTHDLTTYRRAYDDVLLQPRQHALYRNVAIAYMYDDHDFGPNDSASNAPGRDNAVQVYQERVPHYPRGAATPGAPNYQAFQVGRVLLVILDVRADRDPKSTPPAPTKTMLGAGQKSWLDSVFATSTAELLVLVNPSQWDHPTGSDTWAGFPHERDEVVGILGAPGGNPAKSWLDRMCIVQGDAHNLAFSAATPWGGFPLYQFASLDSSPTGEQHWKDLSLPGRAHYGTLQIADTGTTITVTGTGWEDHVPLLQYTFQVPGDNVPITVQNRQPELYQATNTSFGTATTSGTYRDCAVVFTAPSSGRVLIHWSGGVRNIHQPGAALAYISPEVRTGGTIGSGTVVLSAANERTVRTNLEGTSTAVRAGRTHLLSGLTPGATYNVRVLHRVTSQTGEFFQRSLIVTPTT